MKRSRDERAVKMQNRFFGAVLMAMGCLLIINLGYGFEGSFKSIGTYAPQSKAMMALFARLPARLPIPLPQQAVLGFDALKWEIEQKLPINDFSRYKIDKSAAELKEEKSEVRQLLR